MTTDDGINLLEPGKTPHENVQFLLVLDLHPESSRRSMQICSVSRPLIRATTTDWEPTRHRRLLFPFSLASSLQDVVAQLISTGDCDTAA